jgi:hypothetical protein
MDNLHCFDNVQLKIIGDTATMAEDLVSNAYKMSAGEWRRLNYDIKTLAELSDHEIVFGPYAQVVRYAAKPKNAALSSKTYDFYKICVQDHAILSLINASADIRLLPLSLYVLTHELIHIVRFCKFLQQFDASVEEKLAEERRVYDKTIEILKNVRMEGLDVVFQKILPPCLDKIET